MIELAAVSFGYDGRLVVENAELRFGPGLTLLLGPNGCGKTTLLKLLAGVERPDTGRVSIAGHDLWTEEVRARQGLAYVPEQPDLTPYASLLDVLRLVCQVRGEPVARAVSALAEAGLAERAQALIRELSAGQRRRVLLAAAWIGTPRVALLDEPLESLDRGLRDQVLRWIEGLLARGATVVVVSHQIEPFVALATAAVSVRDGRVIGPFPLPDDLTVRSALFESLARGEPPASFSDPPPPRASSPGDA